MNELRRQLDEVSELIDMYLELGETAAYNELLPKYKKLRDEWRCYYETSKREHANAGNV